MARTQCRPRDQTEQPAGQAVENTEAACPECSGEITPQGTEQVCSDCGLVVDNDVIDPGPEWRAFTPGEQDNLSRVGSPVTKRRHDDGLTTEIGYGGTDATGNSLSAEQRKRVQSLRKWQNRLRTEGAKEENLRQALGEIERMASALGVPKSVREVASVTYRRAVEEGLLPGRSIEAVATATLYASCRQQAIPRTLTEHTRVARVEENEIIRAYRYISQELGLEVNPQDPMDFVPRFASDLELSESVVQRAYALIRTAVDGSRDGLSGRSPSGIAASALYLAGFLENEQRTQGNIADVVDVTEHTIRRGYQKIADANDVSVNPEPGPVAKVE